MGSDSDSDEETPVDNTVERYKVEPSANLDQCPLKWWSEHTAVYGHIVQKRRSSLSPDNVNKLVCLSDWWKKEK
uniref:HAT C-terminal dimerisation domain-containing protein n=1 Tax=Nothobranchius rachovii TaxID=451742 RepID=A0A1A8S6V1_9TELE